MAAIKCKECGRDVSSKAKPCPTCGAQVTGTVELVV
ncbi:zinc-ribbon domain-containing protein [Nodosilinea sp. FACHB-13]|nr:zinc-ribbon domain-containing protein [Nodosilinea sp. FACHB-13]MBD2109257.1 zinc-ribbon domain-containing protein [Nodosilinea sp. FACHB-13]